MEYHLNHLGGLKEKLNSLEMDNRVKNAEIDSVEQEIDKCELIQSMTSL